MEVVKTRYGKLIASPNDLYVGRGLFDYGEFSEAEVAFFRTAIGKNDIVCDVGANIGAHTLAFSTMARHVYAYEPQPMLYHALSGMVALNELKNVTTVHAGCYCRDGTLSYYDLDLSSPNNYGAFPLEKFNGHHPIRVIRLDVDCQFLKVDVEGMELDVLRGACDMIARSKPIIYVEADRKEKFQPLLDYIHYLGYFAYLHMPALFNPENFYGKKENIWGDDLSSLNLFCTPEPVPDCEEVKEFPKDYHPQDMKKVMHELGSKSTARV
jgi:FkbM family methyltransferase